MTSIHISALTISVHFLYITSSFFFLFYDEFISTSEAKYCAFYPWIRAYIPLPFTPSISKCYINLFCFVHNLFTFVCFWQCYIFLYTLQRSLMIFHLTLQPAGHMLLSIQLPKCFSYNVKCMLHLSSHVTFP